MTSKEILTALRCCASGSCDGCPSCNDDPLDTGCAKSVMRAAANLIEFQQQGLEVLTKMDEGLEKRGSTLKEFLRRGDEIVQEHIDPTGPPGEPGLTFTCPACGSERVFWNKRDILERESCGWQDKEVT